jgi:ribonuclease D
VITSQAEFHALLERLRGHSEIAIDCEFQREGQYYPRLCLVQIAFGHEAVAIDPFKIDLAPLGEALADNSVLKVLHAAENDLPLLSRVTGRTVRNVWDTQIAAAFVGHGAAPGYTQLVERLRNVKLSKGSQYSTWDARPLSPQQIAYALEDVRHLLPMAAALRQELHELGRLQWAAQEMEEMVAKAFAPRQRSLLYLKLGPFREMTSRHLAVLREVASWRDMMAERMNRPMQRVAPDEALRQLALDPPRSRAEITARRGLQGLREGVDTLLAAIERGLALPDSDCPPVIDAGVRDERREVICSLLSTALRVRANELKIAPSMIARRDQVESLIAWHDSGRTDPPPEIVQTGGWKRAAAGEMLLSILEGRYNLGVSPDAPDGVALTPAPAF